ncbi:MAG: hypothetical protein JSS98_19475 [Bacteroidetes bacterium]|nr:hypothetical protein [Bacteroidota bacterium]
MKSIRIILVIFSSFAYLNTFAQKETITKVPHFKPPVVKVILGDLGADSMVSVQAAAANIPMALKVTDAKGTVYPIESYQFVYTKKGVIKDDQTGKLLPTSTIQGSRFSTSPLPKVWSFNIANSIHPGEELYFFDIVVKDKQGRKFSAPSLKFILK